MANPSEMLATAMVTICADMFFSFFLPEKSRFAMNSSVFNVSFFYFEPISLSSVSSIEGFETK